MTLRELWEIIFYKDIEEREYTEGIRDQRVQIRVTKEEKEIINKLAKLQHMDSSNFIRWLVFKKYIDDFIR